MILRCPRWATSVPPTFRRIQNSPPARTPTPPHEDGDNRLRRDDPSPAAASHTRQLNTV
ncbi:hypothetical protein I551_2044 [Mycobacterium ulcerans str. Harvey]|uniref:Uncharacterized protein n=1 Tax=Mycobacterium ulcerans str. Harvey TaxID=1299332 RepID=A0ABN0R336_MYCUL|nr:hypothetical protein I551_2044 [Mycobacterium ulcerans str. Harvey]